jgi:hypothetical protein
MGVLFDVNEGGFWSGSWGDRPEGKDDRERETREHLAAINLLDHAAHAFRVPPLHPGGRTHVPFWSDLANGAENCDG